MTVRDIYDLIDSFAPFASAEAWDNSGLLIGSPEAEIRRILICLDVKKETVGLAADFSAELIVSHHPAIFHPLKQVRSGDIVWDLVRTGTNVISAHTNLDKAPGGVNDALCLALGYPFEKIYPPTANGFLNVITLPSPVAERDLAGLVSSKLDTRAEYYPRGATVRKVGVCAGSGDDFLKEAAALGCDAYLTGEAHYHSYLNATDLGITLFTAGHFETENRILPTLAERFITAYPSLEFKVTDTNTRFLRS